MYGTTGVTLWQAGKADGQITSGLEEKTPLHGLSVSGGECQDTGVVTAWGFTPHS
ncbi:MAG: hypothetical protein LDL41_04040 [Coleofasciculus sp. S288]|nr:hypothetical protein [Coleofasciculus sp. S288]